MSFYRFKDKINEKSDSKSKELINIFQLLKIVHILLGLFI